MELDMPNVHVNGDCDNADFIYPYWIDPELYYNLWSCPYCSYRIMELLDKNYKSFSLNVSDIEYIHKLYSADIFLQFKGDFIDDIEDKLLRKQKIRIKSKYHEKRYIP